MTSFDELKFKAEDFEFEGPAVLRQIIAEEANRILREKLERAPEVWEYNAIGKSRFRWWNSIGEQPSGQPSAKARLVCIEEVGK